MELPPGCRFSMEDDPSGTEVDFIDERLGDYNAPFVDNPGYDSFGLFVRGELDEIRAGLVGNCYAGWLFIRLLWVTATCGAPASAAA